MDDPLAQKYTLNDCGSIDSTGITQTVQDFAFMKRNQLSRSIIVKDWKKKKTCVCGRFRTSLLTPAGTIAPVLHCSAQGEYLKTVVATNSYRHNPPYKLRFIFEYGSRAMFFCGIYILLIGQLDNREI